jgi:putative protein kinase ArgK-like GTPase of G3E family
MEAIDGHYKRMTASGEAEKLHRERLKTELLELMHSKFMEQFGAYDGMIKATEYSVETILASESDPYSEAERLLKNYLEWRSAGLRGGQK